jgi:hypothetical protein
MSSDKITLNIVNYVHTENNYHPLTGLYSQEDDIRGWIWDIRSGESTLEPSSRGDHWIGGHTDGLKDGTVAEYWQSGTIEGIEFADIAEIRNGEFTTWTPVVNSGRYSVLFDELQLYSDYATSGRFDPIANQNDVNTYSLRSDCLETTVSVNLFERDEELVRKPKIFFKNVDKFTGKIVDEMRVDTVDSSSNILWENLSDRRYEFMVQDGVIYLNGDYSKHIGYVDTEVSKDILESFYEYKGVGNDQGRYVFSQYFPVADYSVEIWILKPDNTCFQLKEVDNLNFSKENDYHFSFDYDLGIGLLGGYKAPDLVLLEDVGIDDREIIVYIDDKIMNSYPGTGIIEINGEKILYYGKGRNRFYDCSRGYEGTTAADHTRFSKVSDIQHGAAILDSEKVFIKYIAVPRVDYEVTPHNRRTANSNRWLDVKAISNVESNNIVQLSTVEPNLAEVELEIDKDSIGGGLFGPLLYGTDVAKLVARAMDSRGNPVEDVELTIVLEGETGGLNGHLQEYSSLSNSRGEIYSFYNAPYNEDSVMKQVDSVTHSGSNSILKLKEDIPFDSSPNSITLYQVLKHDGVFGTDGLKLAATDAENNKVFSDDASKVVGPCVVGTSAYFEDAISRFDHAIAYVTVKNSSGEEIRFQRKVIGVVDHFDRDNAAASGSQFERGDLVKISFILDAQIPLIDAGGIVQTISLIQRGPSDTAKFETLPTGEQEWNSFFLDGVKVLVYEWLENKGTQTIMHPLTGEIGAYYPVRPDGLTASTLTFEGRNLPVPEPNNEDNNLGGYFVVAPSVISFYAWGKDPVSGRIIKSNKIKLKLVLPVHLDGVKDPSGALPVPYGFTFVTEDFNVGSGLGGANFITINSARAPLYIDADPVITDTGASTIPIQLKVGF